jgi:hypothetical protein
VNIFNRIVSNEVQFTELFCNLCGFKAFRDTISDWIADEFGIQEKRELISFNFEDVFTQVTSTMEDEAHPDAKGRPDIMIDNGKAMLILELKVDPVRALTPNQPQNYLKFLAFSDMALCVFIVPRFYAHQGEINSHKGGPVDLKILFWEDLVTEIKNRGLQELNPFMEHFIKLAEEWFPHKDVFFSQQDRACFSSNSAGEALHFGHELVDKVCESVAALPVMSTRKKQPNEHDYAFFLKDATGSTVGYFGLSYEDWGPRGYPFLIGVPTVVDDRFISKHLTELYSEDEFIYYGVDRKIFEGDDFFHLLVQLLLETAGVKVQPVVTAYSFPQNCIAEWFDRRDTANAFKKAVTALWYFKRTIESRDGYTAKCIFSRDEHSISVRSESQEIFYTGLFLLNWKDDGHALWAGVPTNMSSRLERSNEFLNGAKTTLIESSWMYRTIDPSKVSDKSTFTHLLLELFQALFPE